jgi:hypothetical protein
MTEGFDFGIRTGRRPMLRDDGPANMGLWKSACDSTDKGRKKGKIKFSVEQPFPIDAAMRRKPPKTSLTIYFYSKLRSDNTRREFSFIDSCPFVHQ